MYAKADFDDEDTRNQVLEYFVDKIYVYNDRLVITWYYSDDGSVKQFVFLVKNNSFLVRIQI